MEIEFNAASLSGWLQTTPRQVQAAGLRALRRTGTAITGTAITLFRKRGIGRRIFGKDGSGARKLIHKGKLRISSAGVAEQPILIKGLAAIQDRGGIIAQHLILPKNARLLAFPVSGAFGFGGEMGFARRVLHPDSPYPAIPYLREAVNKHAGRLQQELDKDLQRILGKGAA